MTHQLKLSRRNLLAGGVGALALIVVAPQISTATATAPEPYSFQTWSALQGRDVKTSTGATLRIEQVVDLRQAARAGEVNNSGDRFRLHLVLVAGTFGADLITVQHPQAGPVLLFTTQDRATAVAFIDRRGETSLPIAHQGH